MLSASGILTVNSVDVATMGFVVRDWPGLEGRPASSPRAVDVAGRIGQMRTVNRFAIPSRNASIIGKVVADTNAALLTDLDQLEALFGQTSLTMILARSSTRKLIGEMLGTKPDTFHPRIRNRAAELDIPIWCEDPRWYDTSNTVVAFTTATAVPQGSAVTRGIVTITGAASSPITITYKDSVGGTILIVSVATSLADGTETLVIDNQTGLITKNAGGATNVIGLLTSTSRFPFDFDPRYAPSGDGTIETNGGSGSVAYAKAWWTA